MTLQWRVLDLPSATTEWLAWAVLLLVVFVVLRTAAGVPVAVAGAITVVVSYGTDVFVAVSLALILVGLGLTRTNQDKKTLHNAGVVLRQAIFVLSSLILFEVGRSAVIGDAELAISNSRRVLELEQRLGMNFEPALQRLVLRSDLLIDAVNAIYSTLFVPVILASLFWLFVTNVRSYCALRNALVVSALLAVVTFWLYPVASPSLVPGARVLDVPGSSGVTVGTANALAAVPSLHVGWLFLVGYVLYTRSRDVHWRSVFWVPGVLIWIAVTAIGHNYWADGVFGILVTLVPVLVLVHWDEIKHWWTTWMSPNDVRVHESMFASVLANPWAIFSAGAIALLLAFLVIAQLMNPGFTSYWGYMVFQMAATLFLVGWLSQQFRDEGGLSPLTHVFVVVMAYADTLGTAADFYDKYQIFDKITHFLGGLLLAATAYEILYALKARGALSLSRPQRMCLAFAVSLSFGSLWEFYELWGDALFDTGRHAGAKDTIYDLISDTAGSIVAVLLLAILEPFRPALSESTAARSSHSLNVPVPLESP